MAPFAVDDTRAAIGQNDAERDGGNECAERDTTPDKKLSRYSLEKSTTPSSATPTPATTQRAIEVIERSISSPRLSLGAEIELPPERTAT
jgi:hypothetical protein